MCPRGPACGREGSASPDGSFVELSCGSNDRLAAQYQAHQLVSRERDDFLGLHFPERGGSSRGHSKDLRLPVGDAKDEMKGGMKGWRGTEDFLIFLVWFGYIPVRHSPS